MDRNFPIKVRIWGNILNVWSDDDDQSSRFALAYELDVTVVGAWPRVVAKLLSSGKGRIGFSKYIYIRFGMGAVYTVALWQMGSRSSYCSSLQDKGCLPQLQSCSSPGKRVMHSTEAIACNYWPWMSTMYLHISLPFCASIPTNFPRFLLFTVPRNHRNK